MRDTLKTALFVLLLLVGVTGTTCSPPAVFYFGGGEPGRTLTVMLLGNDGSELILFTEVYPGSCRYLPVGHSGFLYNRYDDDDKYVGPAVIADSNTGPTMADCEELL